MRDNQVLVMSCLSYPGGPVLIPRSRSCCGSTSRDSVETAIALSRDRRSTWESLADRAKHITRWEKRCREEEVTFGLDKPCISSSNGGFCVHRLAPP
jgi:hypothetical protein